MTEVEQYQLNETQHVNKAQYNGLPKLIHTYRDAQ